MPKYRPDRELVRGDPCTFVRELVTQHGAQTLARELNDWWHVRGYPQVNHWAEHSVFKLRKPKPIDDDGNEPKQGLWIVRSNLLNGLPPRVDA